MLLLQLLVGLVDRKIEIRRERRCAPGFSDLVVVTEGVVVARKHQDDNRRKESKNAETEDRLGGFRSGELRF